LIAYRWRTIALCDSRPRYVAALNGSVSQHDADASARM